MNQEVKKKWVDALRSGDYKQGKGRLRNARNEFCCLGVLCNIHAQEHPKIAATQHDSTVYCEDSYLLPKIVMEWAELDTDFVDVEVGYGGFSSLADLNDIGYTFHTIADIIEQQL